MPSQVLVDSLPRSAGATASLSRTRSIVDSGVSDGVDGTNRGAAVAASGSARIAATSEHRVFMGILGSNLGRAYTVVPEIIFNSFEIVLWSGGFAVDGGRTDFLTVNDG